MINSIILILCVVGAIGAGIFAAIDIHNRTKKYTGNPDKPNEEK